MLSQVNTEVAAAEHGGVEPSSNPTPSVSTESLLSQGSGGAPAGASSAVPAGPGGTSGQQVVTDAEKYLGVPYVWGGTDPSSGLDCSGLVQRVYRDLGIDLPRTSQEQAQVGTPVASLADAQPGVLVFFAGSDGTDSAPGHVGIYVGNGMMIDAPHTGTDVQIQPVGTPASIRRVLAGGVGPSSLPGMQGLTGTGGPVGGGPVGGGTAGATGEPGMDRLGVPAALQPLFEQAGSRYGVDPLLLASVAKQESGFQADVVSPAGAMGLMQLMPATAAGLGVNATDPASAIDGAAQLLTGYLHRYGGSVPLSLAAYNAGPGAVNEYGGVPPYAETQGYVSNITAMLQDARGAYSGGAR